MSARTLYKNFHIWRLRHLSERTYLLMLSVVVGLLSGLAAVLLKTLVHVVNRELLAFDMSGILGPNALLLLYPLLGILLTVLFVRYIIKGDIGHGIPSVLLAISRKKGVLPPKNIYSALLASTITVAFGGSVGLEAPIASTGSAIGSNIGRLCRLQPKQVKLLLGCGAAGAIAGIFKAPLAGILFVVEVLMFDLSMTTAMPLLVSALTAATVAYFLMGTDVQFAFQVASDFHLSQIPFYIVLGIFCALVSLYFLRVTDRVESWFARRRNWLWRLALGGLVLGLLIFLFPPLFGEGYGSLTDLLHGSTSSLYEGSPLAPFITNGWMVLIFLFMLIALKAVATATTIGSGGVGGTFGPSLVLGGLSGFFVAMLCNQLGLPPQSTANFALVGMAAVMTGVMHAPFMATFLIAEITGGYALLVPLLITSAVTYICITPFEHHSIYARKLAEKGDLLTHDKDQSAWQLMDMRRLIETNFVTVPHNGVLRNLIEAIQQSQRNIFPVISGEGHFEGVIVLDDVRDIIFKPELYDIVRIQDMMHPLGPDDVVPISESPQSVVDKFRKSDRYNLVVVDEERRYLGMLSRANMFSAYRRFISESSDE